MKNKPNLKLKGNNSDTTNSDKDIWNEEKVKKNNFMKESNIDKLMKDGDIEQQRRKKKRTHIKNKQSLGIDKAAIGRKEMKEKAKKKA